MGLPVRIGNIQAEVLKLLCKSPVNEDIKSGNLRDNLDAIDPDLYGHRMDQIVAKFKSEGFLKPTKFGYYQVTPLGRKFNSLVQDGKVTIQNMPPRKPRKTRMTVSQVQPAPPEPVQINLSSRANSLADSLSEVLQENAQLRDLLLKLHTTIGNTLELNKQPEE